MTSIGNINFNTLTITITAPSLNTPITNTFTASGQIIIDLIPQIPSPSSSPIEASKLKLNPGLVDGNIVISTFFPENSIFTNISYTGSPLFLIDNNNNTLINPANYNNVKKIIAGNPKVVARISDLPQSQPIQYNYVNIFIFTFILLSIIGGLIYYFFFYNSQPISEKPKTGGYFIKGE